MEVFTDVEAGSFRTGLPPFQRPTGTKTGSEWCIAVTSEQGQLLTAFYSVIVTLLFVVCWKLVSMVVMLLSHALDNAARGSPRSSNPSPEKYRQIVRDIALVGFWNAREPLEASFFLCGYLTWLPKAPRDSPYIRRPAIVLLILAVVWVLGAYAAGILVAAQLVVGKVAPANPNQVYVPRLMGTTSAEIMRLHAQRAPATLRSLGSAGTGNGLTIRERLTLAPHLSGTNSSQYFTYKYTVNAHDMGLQKWHDLKQEVSGRCDVDSSWFSEYTPEGDLDMYRPWGLANTTVSVVNDGERKTAPSATAISFPYAQSDFLIHQAAEHKYGIIVHSSHRGSHTPGADPWYKTEPFTPPENNTDHHILDPPLNRVMGGRPALSCTQKDVWSYNGKQFKNIFELTDQANINFPKGWVTQLQLDFATPRIIDMINSAGSSSLLSSATFVGGRFDAESSSIESDMIRLFTATWISSAHTFRDMLMVGSAQNIPNAARDGDGNPQDGVDLFVVSTPQVATLRLSVLVTVPVLLVFFTLVLLVLEYWGRGTWHNKTLFAEGAYQFARGQDPSILVESKRLSGVVEKCVGKIHTSSNPVAVPGQQNGGVPNPAEVNQRAPDRNS